MTEPTLEQMERAYYQRLEQSKRYQKTHKEKINEYHRKYYATHYRNNAEYLSKRNARRKELLEEKKKQLTETNQSEQ